MNPHGFIYADDPVIWESQQHGLNEWCQGCGFPKADPIHSGETMPEADETAPIGSPEHRMWFITAPRLCMELIHGCGLTPPKPCWPCHRTRGHEGDHSLTWSYRDEYPNAPNFALKRFDSAKLKAAFDAAPTELGRRPPEHKRDSK